jgi:hypothetical protein
LAAIGGDAQKPPSSFGDTVAFEGQLVEGSLSAIGLEVESELRHLAFAPSATLWRGGEQPLSALRVGDQVLVRVTGGAIERAWANLMRWKGSVIAETTDGYALGRDGHETQEMVVDSATQYEDALTGHAVIPPRRLAVGIGVDAVGLSLAGGGLLASKIRYEASAPPKPGRQPSTPPRITRSSELPDIQCHLHYTGFASFFTCCCGQGRCGTCSTSRSDQTAWPAMDTCGCCTGTCCDCGKTCANSPGWYLPCGYAVVVTDACTGHYKTTFITSCGPCNNVSCNTCSPGPTCSHTCSKCTSRTTPIVDLTKPTFALFYDPARVMCFPCDAEITVAC